MSFYCRVVSKDPLVIIGGTGNGMLGPAQPLKDYLPDRCALLISFWGALSTQVVSNLRYEYSDYRKLYPHRELIFLANDLWQLRELRSFGLPAVMGNHNIFLDENIFKPYDVEKSFDAVYNARMNEEKRHSLCSKLEKVAFIYYFNPVGQWDYFSKVQALMPQAVFINGDPRTASYRHLTNVQCAEVYSSSEIGLCLSLSEGAMLSCMEYLMCGVPVVSTVNVGGRNHFLRSEFSIITEAEPNLVKDAVEWMRKRKLDSRYVRDRIIEVVEYERDRFFADITSWLESVSLPCNFKKEFLKSYVNRMWTAFETPDEFMSENDL